MWEIEIYHELLIIHGDLHVKERSTTDFQLLLNLFTAVLLNGLEQSCTTSNTMNTAFMHVPQRKQYGGS